MLTQSYSFQLQYDIVQGLVASGRLLEDVKASVLVCGTTIGKVILYSPMQTKPNFLNINRDIKALTISRCDGQSDKLVMASENTLIAHDVENNFDMFFKEIPDGISVLASGRMIVGQQARHLMFIGGNCSMQGFDETGEEQYWNVASDDVTCMNLFGGEQTYLSIGSSDNSIRVFEQEEIIYQMNVPSMPLSVYGTLHNDQVHVVYGLENGFIGMFRQQVDVWVDKSEQSKALYLLQLEDNYLIIGRENGQIEMRNLNNGFLIEKLPIETPLCGLLYDDLRGIGNKQIIAVFSNGTVKGYSLVDKEDLSTLQDKITELQQVKQELSQSLLTYQQQQSGTSLLPPGSRLQLGFVVGSQNQCVQLLVQCTQPGTFIQQVVLFSDSLFKNGYVYTPTPQQSIQIPLKMLKDSISAKITCKAMISSNQYGSSFHILESSINLPKFANFLFVHQEFQIQSFVEARIKERVPRYIKWLDQNFILDEPTQSQWESKHEFTFNAINLQNNIKLSINFNSQLGVVMFRCDSIQVCGELIQDLCNFLQLNELSTEGQFPQEMAQFKQVLDKVEQYSNNKIQINADVAESMNIVKSLIVKSEDARLIGDIVHMQKMYANIMVQNKAIQAELLKKVQHTEVLMTNLKEVNNMISKASELRVGVAKSQITTMCRNAVKRRNLNSLIEVIQTGKEI